MTQPRTARLARTSTSWLLLVLCTALLAWRIDSRVEQYYPPAVRTIGVVTFFDANERNLASVDETHFRAHATSPSEKTCLLAEFDRPATLAVLHSDLHRSQPDTPPAVPDPRIQPVTLFPNPPPIPLA